MSLGFVFNFDILAREFQPYGVLLLAVFVAIYCILLSVLAAVKPRWFLFFFLSTKLTIDLTWHEPIIDTINSLELIGGVFPVWAAIYAWRTRLPVHRHPLFKIMIVLLAMNILAGTWGILNSVYRWFDLVASPVPVLHVVNWNVRFLGMAAAVLVLPSIVKKQEPPGSLLLSILLSAGVPILIGLWQLGGVKPDSLWNTSGHEYGVALFPRITGGYQSSGTFAIVLFLAAVSSIYLAATETRRRWVFGLALFFACVPLYFTFSRTIWLTLIVVTLLFLWMSTQKKWVMAALSGIVLLISMVPATAKRFEREINLLKDPVSVFENAREFNKLGTGRMWLWRDAFDHFSRLDPVSKIVGSGGSYGSHNIWIQRLLRNGLLGLVVYSVFLAIVIGHLVRAFKSDRSEFNAFALSLALGVICVAGMFVQIWDHWTFSIFFWMMVGTQYRKSIVE